MKRMVIPFVPSMGLILLTTLSCSGPKGIFSGSGNPTATNAFVPIEPTPPAQFESPTNSFSSATEYPIPVVFSDTDCAFGGLPVSRAFPWGESLECRYDWAGINVDDNQLGFQVTRFYHMEVWDNQFKEDREELRVEYLDPPADQAVKEYLDDADAYGFMTTRPGWTRDNQDISACGYGKAEELYAGD